MGFLKACVTAWVVLALGYASAQSATAKEGLTENGVYRKYCAKCHGKTAEGRHFGGPSLIGEKAAAQPEESLRTVIAEGKGRMPKFGAKLSSAEIDALVKQIRASGKQ